MVWHKDTALPEGIDMSAFRGVFVRRLPALRRNRSPAPDLPRVVAHAKRGGYVLGICNGFQVLTETGLLPGALMRNAGLKFVCRTVDLRVETDDSAFTHGYGKGR